MPKKLPYRHHFIYCNCFKRIEIEIYKSVDPESDVWNRNSDEWNILIKKTIREAPKYKLFEKRCECSN